ncbi:MAG: hypothetical protein IJM30_03745 [Thermoguttaceae bacterium]|nr:hypothetical protein [Thermoguttaceae bacterium]
MGRLEKDPTRPASPIRSLASPDEAILATPTAEEVADAKRRRQSRSLSAKRAPKPSEEPKRGRGRPKGSTIKNGARRPRKRRAIPATADPEATWKPPEFETEPRKQYRNCDKISEKQLDDALDRVVMGERIATIAEELGVGVKSLALRMRKRCGMIYMKAWQNSVQYDCLRAEIVLKRALKGLIADEGDGAKWGSLALKVLEYRAKALGYGAVNPADQTIRVAGLSQEDVFDQIASLI